MSENKYKLGELVRTEHIFVEALRYADFDDETGEDLGDKIAVRGWNMDNMIAVSLDFASTVETTNAMIDTAVEHVTEQLESLDK